MTGTLLIGAGGGGDVIAAAMVWRALGRRGASGSAYFASYAWERREVDPLPGPRDPSAFDGLQRVGEWNYRVTPLDRSAGARPLSPSASRHGPRRPDFSSSIPDEPRSLRSRYRIAEWNPCRCHGCTARASGWLCCSYPSMDLYRSEFALTS